MAQLVASSLRASCCLSQALKAVTEAVSLASSGWARLHVRYAGQPVPSGLWVSGPRPGWWPGPAPPTLPCGTSVSLIL